jgi:hypothetical protein
MISTMQNAFQWELQLGELAYYFDLQYVEYFFEAESIKWQYIL